MAKSTRANSNKLSGDRRNFLKGAVAGTAALLAPAEMAQAAAAGVVAADADSNGSLAVEVQTMDRSGSDFMIDVIRSLGIEYVCANPANTFRAFHESLINYGGNKNPELITCMHEEHSAAMCNGYFKIEGKPAAMICHGTVGLQHAAMAIYNSYGDRAPMLIMDANKTAPESRNNGSDWEHAASDPAALVREMTKWDDNPSTLQLFAESAVRAYRISMTPPTMPVCLVTDWALQEKPIRESNLTIPKLNLPAPPVGDSGAVAEVARLLVQAENPVIVADRAARSQAGMDLLVELAELLQAPVIDRGGRLNFPTQHPLNHTYRARPLISNADVVLGLEVKDFNDVVMSTKDRIGDPIFTRATKPGAKLITINSDDLFTKSVMQTFHRYTDVDVPIAADAHATLPSLLEAVKRLVTTDRKTAYRARGAKLASARQQWLDQTRDLAANGWDDSPISTARLCAELGAALKGEDWSLVSTVIHENYWPLKLWTFDKHYQYIGGPGAGGIGYGAPAAVGGALANKKYGRLSVNIQCDGDLMYCPGVLWTAAHHRIPLLTVMHNNRAYHQEVMEVQRMCNRKNRGVDRAKIGTAIEDPNIDYAKLAAGMGMYSAGPFTDPNEVGPAIKRAIAVVKHGDPALVDLVVQGR
ncbi:MAG: thiamine pyrophosphate-binding protein [Acidobacteriia bacterium]|nr:thiamine pyrophosphate-binding protein [Terriglobia bacterium]